MFIWLFAALMLPVATVWSQKTAKVAEAPKSKVFVADGVLQLAKQLDFKYMDLLKKAENGDRDALKELLQFSIMTDGVDGLNHGVTCLELIDVANDENFALTVRLLKPKLKSLLLERLTLAQGRTTREALRKPLSDWAPMSWAAVNNLPVPGLCDITKEIPVPKPGNNADGSKAGLSPSDNPAALSPRMARPEAPQTTEKH